MAHRSRILSRRRNVGWFDQNWRYDYKVVWLAGNASIREVKIDKTPGARVTAPLRFFGGFPPWVRDPRVDVAAPSGWTLIQRAAQFEFMIQPPPLGPLGNFIPPLIAPPPFAPAPPPRAGLFRVYSVENPRRFRAFTVDHLNARFPAAPNAFRVWAPNHKVECARITAACVAEREGYRYTYTVSAEVGDIWQAIVFLQPEVKIREIEVSDPAWQTYRVGFDDPDDCERADGDPTKEEAGVLYLGSWERPVSRDGGLAAVAVSFFSMSRPGYVFCLGNKFEQLILGPVEPHARTGSAGKK